MREDDDERDADEYAEDSRDEAGLAPSFPAGLKVACYLWIGFGILILVGGLIGLVQNGGQIGAGGQAANQAPAGGVCGMVLVGLFGAAFIAAGSQTLKGTAKDTMGNGIGSLVFALLEIGLGVLALNFGVNFFAIIYLACGAGLMGAGIIALMNRTDYLEWRAYKKKTSSTGYFKK